MRLLHASAFAALVVVGGCMSQSQTTPEYGGDYAGLSTGPGDESYSEPTWVGPPGGAIDPGYGYDDPSVAQSPSAQSADPSLYGGDLYGGQTYGQAFVDPSAPAVDPNDPNAAGVWAGATGNVTDGEIDMTLDAYGEWVEEADYGRVWRPYNTVVGTDFTPYESCGSWVFTEYGWTFQSCDEWAWGWLPFHYGRWVYLDDGWCWSRDYTWGPAWVEWRHGGGYVGWRPERPRMRDHRGDRGGRDDGPRIRDHRDNPEKWTFTPDRDFGKRPIRSSPHVDVREGLRATTSVAQPPIRGDVRNRASTVMAGRLRDHQRFEARTRGTIGQSTRGYQPSRGYNNSVNATRGNTRGYNNSINATRGYNNSINATRGYNPTYNPTVVSPDPNRPTWNRNANSGYRYNPNANANGGYRAPTNGGYNPPANTGYRAPTNGGYRYNPPANTGSPNTGYRYNPPANTGSPNTGYRYNPPANTRAPANSGYRPNPPSSSGSGGYRYNPPSRAGSSWGGSRGSAPTPPSRPSTNWRGSSSSSSSGTRSYSAPSRSYSAPSRSYSAPSRSSSSSSSSSHSWGGSRGSSSSSSSHSSGGSHGGGRHR